MAQGMTVVCDEDLVEGDTIADAESFISRLRESGLKADLFTFAQRLPDVTPNIAITLSGRMPPPSHQELCTLVASADGVQDQKRC